MRCCPMHADGAHAAAGAALRRPAAVVVAHPDDEALWLSSIVGSVDRVVFCFGEPFGKPEKAAARRRALAALPLPGVIDLAIPESGARSAADWAPPRATPTGIAIVDTATGARYDANYHRLIESLRDALAGCRSVFTHNPWGEYGHAEHVQVHRAVVALQAELRYMVWFSNYVGNASWPLARQLAGEPRWSERRVLRPDRVIARRLKRVYLGHRVWTWTRAHRWPARETLYAQPPDGDRTPRQPFAGERLVDVAGLRWWSAPWRPAARALR